MSVAALRPLPTRGSSASLSPTSTSALGTAVPAMPAPMKPEPTTPRQPTSRALTVARRDAVVLLERGGGEEDLDQLAGDVGHGQLAEFAVLLGQAVRHAVLQAPTRTASSAASGAG